MAITLTLGSYDLYSGTLKLAAKNGWQRGRADSDIETFHLVAAGSEATIVIAVDAIDDQLVAAEKYISNLLEATPVWLAYNADGETAKRALVRGGQLSEVSQGAKSPLLRFDMEAAILVVERGPWEDLTTDTTLSAVNFDWSDPTQNINSIPGTIDSRIDELAIASGGDNDESTALKQAWIGIRPEYQGRTGFVPIWEAELAVMGTDTAIASVNDSNTSPIGSSTNNCAQCTFGTATLAKRWSCSLGDALWYSASDSMTNGGAEVGDMTGWTEVDAGWAASAVAAHIYAGSYGFYSNCNNVETHRSYQDIAVSPNNIVRYSVYYKQIANSNGGGGLRFSWRDSSHAIIGGYWGGAWMGPTGAPAVWTEATGRATAPTSTAYCRVELWNITSDVFAQSEICIDNIVVKILKPLSWFGRYKVLARVKLDAASTEVGIQMKYGYSGTTYKAPKKGTIIENTSWKLVSLGTVEFPPGRATTGDTLLRRLNKLMIEIWAERLSGAADLFIDAIGFVSEEHSLYLNGISVCRSAYDAAIENYYYAGTRTYTRPDGSIEVLADSVDYDGIDTNVEFSPNRWELPTASSVIIAFAQRSTIHYLADTFNITMATYPRWLNRNAQ